MSYRDCNFPVIINQSYKQVDDNTNRMLLCVLFYLLFSKGTHYIRKDRYLLLLFFSYI